MCDQHRNHGYQPKPSLFGDSLGNPPKNLNGISSEGFESWFKKTGLYNYLISQSDSVLKCDDNWYENQEVQAQWEVWQAATQNVDRLKDQPLKWITEVKRIEDMSSKGYLKIMRDGDGDVIVVVCAADGDKLKASESVEFCVGRGGNRSPNTVNALIRLAEAMEKDNSERPIRAG